MSKLEQVLIYSIQPEHVLNFLTGRKTYEIRKRDLPQWAKDKIARGEVVEGYGYCTKGKPYLEPRECNGEFVWNIHNDFIYHTDLNGKVVVKFEMSGTTFLNCGSEAFNSITEKSCLTLDDLINYCDGKDLYAHHFTNITPIEPMEIGEFYGKKKIDIEKLDFISKYQVGNDKYEYYRITKAPQSFQTAWVKEVVE